MREILKYFLLLLKVFCVASYHEQYRVPKTCTDRLESYVMGDREYLMQNFPATWENANILCRGQYNGTLAILDTKEKAEFLAESLAESQFDIESVWVGASRISPDHPAGYRWSNQMELRRTAADVLNSEADGRMPDHYPVWLNRTLVPVPEGGADCVALERVNHDKPVFLDLPCSLERPFACERKGPTERPVTELKMIRCRSAQYHVFNGKVNWHQAAAHCVLNNMSLANIGSMKCLKKLGTAMLKTRPSIENAWIGARGALGKWTWLDTGVNIFQTTAIDARPGEWPPLRDRTSIKQAGCLQLDRHATHPPVFLEARCERKMEFICFKVYTDNLLRTAVLPFQTSPTPPVSDDMYYYVLVKQMLHWQNAYDNCVKLNGTLASVDNHEIMIQLLLVMGENKEEPISHIWLSGRLNDTKDASDAITYNWYNPANDKKIPDYRGVEIPGVFTPPWLDEEFSVDSPCLNLDRQDHLSALVYGLSCDTPQYSICMIEKSPIPVLKPTENLTETVVNQ